MKKQLLMTLLVLSLVACNEKESTAMVKKEVAASAEILTKPAVMEEKALAAQPEKSKDTDLISPQVKIETTLGTIVIELDGKNAPISTKNFLGYVESGYYNETIFHRVISDFMIQGGGFSSDLKEKQTKASIQNEATNGLLNVRGTISMARTSAPHSASAQFFINTRDNKSLDHRDNSMRGWGYAVFGKVVSGMDVVDKIESVPTGNKIMNNQVARPFQNVPTNLIIMKSVTVVK